MPYIVSSPDSPTSELNSFELTDFKYTYPNGLDLKPGSNPHQRILGRVLRYGQTSAAIIRGRHRSWHDIDEKLTAYITSSHK